MLNGTRHLRRFDTLLGLAQHYALLREEQGNDFTLGWPLLRRCLTAIGEHLRDDGVIAAPEDVYFLTLRSWNPEQARSTPSSRCAAGSGCGKGSWPPRSCWVSCHP
ncbi:MAG: hypothetical protein M3536_12145, partial [Actinomycetota bacterium]|nr:hypothetical protein [Actinomycetota bacterium]